MKKNTPNIRSFFYMKALQYFANLKKIWDGENVCIIEGENTHLGEKNDLFNNAKKIDHIIAPSKNAFTELDDILKKAKNMRIFNAIRQITIKDILAPIIFIIILIPSIIFRITLTFKHRKLWLITEGGEARDNGFCLFKYIREKHPSDYCYYAIDVNSPSYEKIAKLGNFVKYGSLKHWLYYMSANLNISSQKGANPSPIFWYFIHVILGLYKNRVFLQHGVTINNATWLHYKKTKFKYFITAIKPEHLEITKNFGYPKGSVVMAGFPRWEKLKNTSKNNNTILIMPTWRKYLGIYNNNLFNRQDFTDSTYYKMWNGLLNDKTLIDYIEKRGIKIFFYPHQNIQNKLNSFKPGSSNIKLVSIEEDIALYLSNCAIMVTDYSSVMFDFAYLKKPVICYQFDEAEYRAKQYDKGYFDYKQDGFGPVAKCQFEVVNLIKQACDNTILPMYKNRFSIFNKTVHSSSERIYNLLKWGKQ